MVDEDITILGDGTNVDVKITDVLPNVKRELVFAPVDLTEGVITPQAATQFSDNFRLKVAELFRSEGYPFQVDYAQKENWTRDVSSLDLLQAGSAMGVPVIVWQETDSSQTDDESSNWRLVLERPTEERPIVQMWEPTRNEILETLVSDEEALGKMHDNGLAASLGERYSLLVDTGNGSIETAGQGLQINAFNSGPTVLLDALLRANALGYVNDENRKKIEDNFGLKMPDVPGINAITLTQS